MTCDILKRIIAAQSYSDEHFAAFQMSADPLAAKISGTDRMNVLVSALSCGKRRAETLRQSFGSYTPMQIAQSLGIEIIQQEFPGPGTLLARHEPGSRRIALNQSALASIGRVSSDLIPVFGSITIAEIILAHELFHYLEAGDSGLFTRTYKVVLWRVGPIAWKSAPGSISEIAANICAKTLCDLPVNPLLIEPVWLRCFNAEAASAWLERLGNTTYAS